MGKRYGWADVAGGVSRGVAPVAGAGKGETGRTVGELVAAGRRVAAGVLRRLADALAGVPTVAPVANAAMPVAVPEPTPPATTTPSVLDTPPQTPRRTRTPKPTLKPAVVP